MKAELKGELNKFHQFFKYLNGCEFTLFLKNPSK